MATSFLVHPSYSSFPDCEPISIPELYDWHHDHNNKHPLYIYENTSGILQTLTIGEAVQGFHAATQYILNHVSAERCKPSSVIAILASSETISYISVIMGILRAGYIAFPISPRNSPSAIAHLLSTVSAACVLVSSETAIKKLFLDSIKLLNDADRPKELCMPVFDNLFPSGEKTSAFKWVPMRRVDINATACIYHSSGSTSFPQPIYLTHRAMYCFSTVPTKSSIKLNGLIYACHSVPIFHGMGWMPLTFPTSVGLTIAVFKPSFPPIVPNPCNSLDEALSTKADFLLTAPSFPEAWAENRDQALSLSKLKGLVYSGGPLAKSSGDILASLGVNVYLAYGTTQTALLSQFVPGPPGMDWEYFKFTQGWKIHLEEYGGNQFEVVVIDSNAYKPYIFNGSFYGTPAYSTGDIVSAHPDYPDRYRLVGRTDDQIIHSNGEKTNPTPLEHILNKDPYIEASIVFGRGQVQCGVLIQPKQNHTFDPTDTKKLITFRNSVWQSVEKVNNFAPTHSRIFKEMILVTSPSKPFQYTSKHTVRRQYMINEYEDEIKNLYASVSESAQEEIQSPTSWSEASTLHFTRIVIEATMKNRSQTVSDEVDLFEHGMDSLQATWIRNTFLRILRSSKPGAEKAVPVNFVYAYPTIKKLAAFVYNAVNGSAGKVSSLEGNKKLVELQELIARYSRDFPVFSPASSTPTLEGDVILLTGSTGSLGSNILSELIVSDSVKRVYALSRHIKGEIARDRLSQAFLRNGLDQSLLQSEKLRILEGDTSEPDFSIEYESYSEMLCTVTHVIHAAWMVNFNNSVSSFEKNIKGLRHLIDFALQVKQPTSARLIFISSVGVFRNSESRLALEEPIENLETAMGSGYSESKLVSEKILEQAATHASLRATIIRMGQLTGGRLGAWNEQEWFPSLVKTSIALQILPDMKGNISWISSNAAAGIVMKLLHSDQKIIHLVNPRPITWSSLIAVLSNLLKLRVTSYEKWLGCLQSSVTDDLKKDEFDFVYEKMPALRLLDFFQTARIGEEYEPLGLPNINCEKLLKQLHETPLPLAEDEIRCWFTYWFSIGFIPQY